MRFHCTGTKSLYWHICQNGWRYTFHVLFTNLCFINSISIWGVICWHHISIFRWIFHALRVLRFEDETSLEAGIRVQIHSQDEPPYIHQLGFGVSPGFQTFVSCQEQRVGLDRRHRQAHPQAPSLPYWFSPEQFTFAGCLANKSLCSVDISAPALGELPLQQQGEVPRIRHLQHQRLSSTLRDQWGCASVQLSDGAHARYDYVEVLRFSPIQRVKYTLLSFWQKQ